MSLFPTLFAASGWLGYLFALFIAGILILTVPFIRWIAWTGIKVLPAVALLAIGVMAVPFWRPLMWGMTRVPLFSRVGGLFAGLVNQQSAIIFNTFFGQFCEARNLQVWMAIYGLDRSYPCSC